jgi:hypothetical protein
MIPQILDHAVRAVARLAAQFSESTRLRGMIEALGDEIQTAEDGLYGVLLTRDLDNAADATLDLIGKLVGAPARGNKTDAEYRNRVKAQILANRSPGNADTAYRVSKLVMPEWDVSGQPQIIEDRIAGYTIGCTPVGSIVNDTENARDLGRILDDVNPAGVRGIVLSQTQNANLSFCFQHGPGLGFGHGAFVGAYDGGQHS